MLEGIFDWLLAARRAMHRRTRARWLPGNLDTSYLTSLTMPRCNAAWATPRLERHCRYIHASDVLVSCNGYTVITFMCPKTDSGVTKVCEHLLYSLPKKCGNNLIKNKKQTRIRAGPRRHRSQETIRFIRQHARISAEESSSVSIPSLGCAMRGARAPLDETSSIRKPVLPLHTCKG